MLKYFLRSAYWLTRARSSPVGSYLDGFATTLREIGYCKRIGTGCIAYAVHLAFGLQLRDCESKTWTRRVWAHSSGTCLGAIAQEATPVSMRPVASVRRSSCGTCAQWVSLRFRGSGRRQRRTW
jgi:hypothetical protein